MLNLARQTVLLTTDLRFSFNETVAGSAGGFCLGSLAIFVGPASDSFPLILHNGSQSSLFGLWLHLYVLFPLNNCDLVPERPLLPVSVKRRLRLYDAGHDHQAALTPPAPIRLAT